MSTLIEKLERESDRLHKLSVDFSHDTRLRLINEALGIYRAIDIVKKHQGESVWISVDERLPDDRSLRYELFTPSDDMTLRHRFCHCDDVKKSTDATHWRVAQQPPIEVQP